jgi:hypothetical protein
VVAAAIPPPSIEEQAAGIAQATQLFSSVGLGAVRDPIVQRDELLAYQAAWERGRLSTRCQPMLNITPTGTVAERIAKIAGMGSPTAWAASS